MQFDAAFDDHDAGRIGGGCVHPESGAEVNHPGLGRVQDESLAVVSDIDRRFSRMDPDMHRIDETQLRRGEQFDRHVVGQTQLQQPFVDGEIPDTAPAAGLGRKAAVRDPDVP